MGFTDDCLNMYIEPMSDIIGAINTSLRAGGSLRIPSPYSVDEYLCPRPYFDGLLLEMLSPGLTSNVIVGRVEH